MGEPFIGEIRLVPYNFNPRGWAFCQGQILSIAQNTALFSLLGTTYGGNGQTTFALPDLRGRAAAGQGQGPGLSNLTLGEQLGVESVTLNLNEIPAHSHDVVATSGTATSSSPVAAYLATLAQDAGYSSGSATVAMAGSAVSVVGGSQPHENRQPYLVLNYIIALEGIFPSRS